MALVSSEIPVAAAMAIEQALERLGDRREAPTNGPYLTNAPVHAVAPQELFTLDLPKIERGQPLVEAAVRLGDRYLLWQDHRAVAVAEVREPPGQQPRAYLNFGPFAPGTEDAIGVAEKLEEVQQHDYWVRFLALGALRTMALWLRSVEQAAGDVIVPLAPAPLGLEPLSRYAVEAFEGWIKRQLKLKSERRSPR